MHYVFVLDTVRIPQSPVHPAVARKLLSSRKGHRTAAEFGHADVHAQAQQPLQDAAAVNATRWALYQQLSATGLPVEVGTGGRTKYNRTRQGLPKAHWTDAACVGASTPLQLQITGITPLHIRVMGRGTRQRCGTNRYGVPIRHRTARKRHSGFSTGDIVRAQVPAGRFAGVYVGRVTVRSRPAFKVERIETHPRYLTLLHRSDGYAYRTTPEEPDRSGC
jgi:hypothetical protein